MITITNNQGGEETKLTVSRGAYETFYKRLGYSILEDKKVEVSAVKVDTSAKEEITEKVEKPKEKVSKNKKISD